MATTGARVNGTSGPDEDPNRPFSVARVAVWALGIIGLTAVIGLIVLAGADQTVSASLRGVVQTSIGALAAVAATRSGAP